MVHKKPLFLALGLIGALAGPVHPETSGTRSNSSDPRARLEGTWLVRAKFVEVGGVPITDGALFKVLFTFMPGRTDDEGTLIDTNEFQFTPNPICTPDQGVWRRVGRRDFIATQLNFCFDQDQNGNPAGPTKIRGAIRLSRNGEEMEIRQFTEGFDTEGKLVFEGTVVGRGQRVQAEAPPR